MATTNSAFTLADVEIILQKVWKHPGLREMQVEALKPIVEGKDVLSIIATGVGKSAIFQIPAVIMHTVHKQTTIVVSPLIALMKDQVEDAQLKGISASYINSFVDVGEIRGRLEDMVNGKFALFYVSPETLRGTAFFDAIMRTDVAYVVVDEAHCCSIWGHNFRPAYQRIHEVVSQLRTYKPHLQVLGFTATATAGIAKDIAKGLGMRSDYVVVRGDPVRENFTYEASYTDSWKAIRAIVADWDLDNGRYVVYCGSRGGAEKVASAIASQLGFPHIDGNGMSFTEKLEAAAEYGKRFVAFYHAGMERDDTHCKEAGTGKMILVPGRVTIQDNFKSGKTPVVIATNAFGMGIDVPNIREVVHFGIPRSIEDMCQEQGRAGRDGLPSRVTLLVDDFSINLKKRFADFENPPWDTFVIMRDYLKSLGSGRVTTRTTLSMKLDLKAKMGFDLQEEYIDSVLNTLDAFGIVRRSPTEGGTIIHVEKEMLKDTLDICGDYAIVHDVAKYIYNDISKIDLPKVQVVLRYPDMVESTGYTQRTIQDAIKTLRELKVLKTSLVFSGKATQIQTLEWGNLVTREVIEARRDRAFKRIERVLDYVYTADKKAFIRNYFAGDITW